MSAETKSGEAEVRLGLWANLLAPMGWGAGGKVAKAQKLIHRARAAAQSDPAEAIALCSRSIDLLYEAKGFEAERKQLLGSAQLRRGELQEKTGDTRGAVESYLRARDVLPGLPLAALTFAAAQLAGRGDASERAVTVYIDLLRGLHRKDKPAAAGAVYTFLEKQAAITEGEGKADGPVALCRRVVNADPGLDWPHHYLGIDALNRGQFDDALLFFEKAAASRTSKPLNAYYIHFTKGLQRARTSAWDQAVQHFRSACQTAARPEARFWLGKSLVEWVGPQRGAPDPRVSQEAIDALLAVVRSERRMRQDAYYLGRGYALAGRFAEAEPWLQEAARTEKTNAACFLHLGRCEQALGAHEQAAAAARSAVQIDAKLIDGHRLLASASVELKDFQTAERHLQIVVAADASDAASREQWGNALYALGKWKEAITALRPLGDLRARPGLAFVLARCHAQTGDFREAEKLLRAVTGQSSVAPESMYYLGLALAHLEQWQESVKELSRALQLPAAQAEWFLQRGHVYSKLGDTAKAAADYESAAKLKNDSVDALYFWGRSCLESGDTASARQCFTCAVRLAPSHAGAVLGLAAVYERDGAYASACVQYATAVALEPKNAAVRRYLGVARFRQGEREQGLKDLRQAIQLGDGSDEVLYYCGLAAASGGCYSEAMESWEKLLRRHSTDQRLALNVSRLRYLIGEEHAKTGKYAEAIREWAIYADTRPEDEDLRREIAKLHLRLGLQQLAVDTAKASTSIASAVSLDPENPVYGYYASLAGLQEGKWDSYAAALPKFLPHLPEPLRQHAKYHLGLARLAQGKLVEAEQALQEAGGAAFDTSMPVALLHARAGRWADAAEALLTVRRAGA
jgi:tetratricopeptide (TPR) repeat protein